MDSAAAIDSNRGIRAAFAGKEHGDGAELGGGGEALIHD
jgi:hypothetical protein